MFSDRHRRQAAAIGRHKGWQSSTRCDIDQVGNNGRGGRTGAGTAPLQHDLTDKIALNNDGVKHTFDLSNRRGDGDEGRVDALLDTTFGQKGGAEQLDPVPQLLGVFHVQMGNIAYPLDIDRREIDGDTEGDTGENSQFMGGVVAIDVEAWIGLRVAELLRLGEHIGKVATTLPHRREDVITGSVENAGNTADTIGGKALAQGLDDRNAASDRCLEAKRDRFRGSQPAERDAMMGE